MARSPPRNLKRQKNDSDRNEKARSAGFVNSLILFVLSKLGGEFGHLGA